ncbi:MAG: hypothetical protein IIB58_05625 [Planctomycetes bacterium]|nr:hypothetical protein [Planctomycetota bacterium]
MRYARIFVLAIAASSVVLSQARAADQPGKFTLAKIVPAGSLLYHHRVANPEREFLTKHWSHVWKALRKSGIDKDIMELITAKAPTEEDRADFENHWTKATELFAGVKWSDLTANESLIYVKSPEDCALMFRPKTETLASNVQGLIAILEELANFDEGMRLDKSGAHGGHIWTLSMAWTPTTLNLFRRGDVLGFTISETAANDILAALARAREYERLVDTPRYREAMAQLPKPEDSLTFMDVHNVFSMARGFAEGLIAVEAEEGIDIGGGKKAKILANLFREVDIIDYFAATEETDGLKTLAHSVAKMTPEARSKKLYKAVANQKPITGVLEHVPASASGYSATSGIDLGMLYSWGKDMLEHNFDEGPQWLARWAEWQQVNEFNLQDEILSWIDGSMIGITFPGAIQTGFGASKDIVFKIKVNDDAKARDSFFRQLDRFSGTLMMAPAADVNAEGFRSISHMTLMMLGMKITAGVDHGWLYISNSARAINKCLATAAGAEPSIVTNERYKREGIMPKGPINSASFADTSNAGQEWAMAFGLAPMGLIMIQPSPETMQLRSVLGMMGKLAPVLAEKNFERSRSSVCRLEGDRWVSQRIVNYKEYTPRKETQVPDLAKQREDKKKVKSSLEGL